MSDENNVTADPGENEEQPPVPKKTLPPLTSARPAGGAAKSLPPLASGRPAGQAAPRPAVAQASPASAQKPAAPISSSTVNSQAPASTSPTSLPAAPTAARPIPATAPAKTEVRKPRQDKPPEDDNGIWRMNRKNFLNVAGWFGFAGFLVTATLGAIRLMVPRVLYEAPSAFKAGYPEDFVVGEVNEKYKDEYRVWIVRSEEGFYALSAICTHLGCTPRWLGSESKFKCPCHGSGYHKDGVNFEGPTPRPLERLKITLGDDGQILVDRNIKFLYEKQEWSKPDAFLKYS